MDLNTILWLIGTLIITMSWFRIVPWWVSWVCFFSLFFLFFISGGSIEKLEWPLIWIVGLILVVLGWTPWVHKSVSWAGFFITLTIVGMEWIADVARNTWHDPVILISPNIDLLIYCLIFYIFSNEWFLRHVKNDPYLVAISDYVGCLRAKSFSLQYRDNPQLYKKRESVYFYRGMAAMWDFHEIIGSLLAKMILISIFGFLIIVANYYNTGVEFSFFFFTTNWFWAIIIYLFLVGVPLYYLEERLHGLILFKYKGKRAMNIKDNESDEP